ncbi:MAG: N-acetylmuramoyl-L-alanine amidase [Patescibacteria group bacterium]
MKKVLSQFKPFLVIFAAILLAVLFCPQKTEAAASPLTIITREQWEADADYLLDSDKDTIWPLQYQRPQKFVIHHTAGSNGGDNPEATVRAIYYYHAQILGWGDIGYNYLIDSQGNIYEGRKGGDGVVGAHAFRDSGCNVVRFGGSKEGIDFNEGTIGISLLGNYEESQPSQKAINALVKLIAHKGASLGINPNAKLTWRDIANMPNVVGHQDVDCTLCPGSNVEIKLSSIRSSALSLYQSLKDTGASFIPVAKAELTEQSAKEITLEPGETATIWAKYKNTGNFTWRRYFEDTVYLASADYGSNSLLQLTSADGNHIDLLTANVAPQEIGKISFTIEAPADQLEITDEFYLMYDGKEIPDTRFNIKVNVIGFDYAGNLIDNDVLSATFTGARLKTTFSFQNRGVVTWTKNNTHLNIYDLGLAPSVYQDGSWASPYGQIVLNEEAVKSGQTGTFTFYLKSPNSPGNYKQIFKLFCEDQEAINGEFDLVTRVDSHFKAELVEHNIPQAIQSAWRPKAVVKFKNTGLAIWDQNMRLNIYDLNYKPSLFYDSSWNSTIGQIRLKEKVVRHGEIGTFEFYYFNRQPGFYHQLFELDWLRNDMEVTGGNFGLVTRVD